MNFLNINPEGLLERTAADFESEIGKTPDPIELVFWRQEHLMELYQPIEKSLLRGRVPDLPLDLHDAIAQSFLKERAWWVTEELIEAQWGCWENNSDKVLEELADALHFQTELCISAECAYVYPHSRPRHWPHTRGHCRVSQPREFRQFIMAIMEELGIGMWQFRNKAWKQTQVLTDIGTFQLCMMRAQRGIVDLMGWWAPPGTDRIEFAVTTYLRKSEVNLWRIKTKY